MRTRFSAALDGELSELETVQVRAHLEACRVCAAFEVDMRRWIEILRNEPHQRPSDPIVVPHARRATPRTGVAAATARSPS
jgi:predicted anti-sigma-YlaC factor YlaD